MFQIIVDKTVSIVVDGNKSDYVTNQCLSYEDA